MTHNENQEHEPFVDADDTHESINEELENHDGPRNQGEKVAEDLKRIATDAAHAAAGFAGFLGDKAREFYDEQRKQYVEAHPESEDDPEAKQFLNQIRDRFNSFFEDLSKGYKDMADRGSQYFKSGATEAGDPPPADESAAVVVDDIVVDEGADVVVDDVAAADGVNPDLSPEGTFEAPGEAGFEPTDLGDDFPEEPRRGE